MEDPGNGHVAWDRLHHVIDGRGKGTIEKEVFDILIDEKVRLKEDGRRRDPSPARSPVRVPRGGGSGGHQPRK